MGSVSCAVDENLGVEIAVKENFFTTDEHARWWRDRIPPYFWINVTAGWNPALLLTLAFGLAWKYPLGWG